MTIHDHDSHLDSRNRLRVVTGEAGETLIDFADFAAWLVETAQADDCHSEGEGMIMIDGGNYEYFDQVRNLLIETKRGNFVYTFPQYLKEFGCTSEFTRMLEAYLDSLKMMYIQITPLSGKQK